MLNDVGARLSILTIMLCTLSCGEPGVVEVQRVAAAGSTGSPMPAPPATPGPCPSGWNCMDLSALGGAMDGAGQPVSASCSKGGIMACTESDPASSCDGLNAPICVHLNVGGQSITSCGQRCVP